MRFVTQVLLDEAREELRAKTPEQIEFETAARWAARAIAAYELGRAGNRAMTRFSIEAQHESIEHAASAGLGMADAMTEELRRALTSIKA